MLNAVLKVVGGKQDGKLIPLNTKKFLIGREQDCHLRAGSESVSRHHCAITIDDFGVRVRDLGSSNGTSINGKRIIGVHEANPGDALQIGNLDFEIVFRKSDVLVTSGVAEKGGTSFSLDEFALEEAKPLSDTAMMVGGDTAVISTSVAGAVTQEIPIPAGVPTDESRSATEAVDAQAGTIALAADASVPTETTLPEASPAEAAPAETVAVAVAEAAPAAPPQPAEAAPAAQQPAPQGMPPGYQQPAAPVMPGYPQQMPQQPYPYGMPQPGMPQPGMPGYGMPQQGYPYGVPQQPPMPGYGMPQPGMPGYGMPQQPAMPYPGQQMPYPQQQVPYPAAQPPAEEYHDDEEDDVEETSEIQEPPTVLPDPSETGAVDQSKADVSDDEAKPEEPNPAADILKKYMGGR